MRSRRSLLVALAAGSLAGCLQGQDPATDEASDPTDDAAPGAAENGTDDESDVGSTDDSSSDEGETESGGPAFDASSVGSLIERFDVEPATRPTCDVEVEQFESEADGETSEFSSVGTVAYPDPPETFTRETVIDFLAAHEEAYVQNDYVCGQSSPERLVNFSVNVIADAAVYLDWYDDVHVVRFDHAFSAYHWHEEGALSVADGVPRAGVYAVDETAAVRVGAEGRPLVDDPVEENTPDPVAEGDLLVTF